MPEHGRAQPELSVVVPVHREAEQIDELVAAISRQLDRLGGAWELILVDDGSPDDTWPAVEAAVRRHPGQTFTQTTYRGDFPVAEF